MLKTIECVHFCKTHGPLTLHQVRVCVSGNRKSTVFKCKQCCSVYEAQRKLDGKIKKRIRVRKKIKKTHLCKKHGELKISKFRIHTKHKGKDYYRCRLCDGDYRGKKKEEKEYLRNVTMVFTDD